MNKYMRCYTLVFILILVSLFSCDNQTVRENESSSVLLSANTSMPIDYDNIAMEYFINYGEIEFSHALDTLKITIDGTDQTLYLYESIRNDTPGVYEEYYPIAVLTNAKTATEPPTIIKENDIFLGWKAEKINNSYLCYDNNMYFGYVTDVQFKGEITVKAKIIYQDGEYFKVFALIDDEYQPLFPEIIGIDKTKDRMLGFYNEDKIIELLGNKMGVYECKIKIQDFHLYYVHSEVINMATLIEFDILSVIE